MNSELSVIRRIAVALMLDAAHILPSERSAWAEAMQHEILHIDNDLAALNWAVGCVLASYVERSIVMNIIYTWPARIILALLIGLEVPNMLFATVLTAAYRLHYLGVAEFLGQFTPGDDYRRFIPLMQGTDWSLHVLWVLAAILFAASAVQFLRKRRSAFLLFAAAWILGTIGDLISRAMPVYRQTFSFPTPMFTRDYLIPISTALLPILIAAALWFHARHSSHISAAH